MRALAILLVVVYHARLGWATGGYLGVDVFFVLSGFLITGIIADEVRRTGRLSLANFWARRARRLVPAAVVMIGVSLAVASWISSPFVLGQHARTAFLSALYSSNFLFLLSNADYFAINSQPNLLLHTWSLSVEEQFYLLFAPMAALVCVLSRRGLRGGVDIGDRTARFRRVMTWLLGALVIASFVACLVLGPTRRVMVFYLLPTRLWELGVGALVALRGEWIAERLEGHGELATTVALAAVVASAMWADDWTPHPGWMTLAAVVGTATLIVVGMSAVQPTISRLLSARSLGAIGRLSYSWYLWHWPMLVLLEELAGRSTPAQRVAVILLSLGVATASRRWVEAPIHGSRRLAGYPRLSLATTLAVSLALALVGRKVMGRANRAVDAPALAEARLSSGRPPFDCMGMLRDRVTGELCEFGPDGATKTVLMFGDSHMAQWLSALQRVAHVDRVRFVAFVKSACPAAAVHVEGRLSRQPDRDCDRWRSRALALADTLRPDLILVSSRHDYRVMLDDQTLETTEDQEARDAWAIGLEVTLRRLAAAGRRVVLLRDSPEPGFIVRDCLTTRHADPHRCDVPLREAEDSVIAAIERAVAARVPGVAVADLNDEICPRESCLAVRDSTIVFRDTHHLSSAFVEQLTPDLRSLVRTGLTSSATQADVH